jgi:PTH1 family peptidyl-tRNA hydrolase
VIDAFCADQKISLPKADGRNQIGRGLWGETDFLLLKPGTYMNRSGIAVQRILTDFKISHTDMVLIHDDLDMEAGRIRIRTKGSAGGHRGVASVIDTIGSDLFLRIKIGIGRSTQQSVVDYVLTSFSQEERTEVQKGVDYAVSAIPWLLEGRVTEAMNRYNVRCN